ncbi:polymorphic toxin type 15 domain-containing protein [Acidocella facilis]|uniref:polymorphic toxin type 15 domain-containing protein n=1 Tax=Acidocella facilis TaxID=525 RepID=UPI00047E5115|nr:polymorphic toxin type 15 domain-containing protein [Acidocella facilis]
MECGDALPCFNTPAGQSEAETKKQLQEQQDLINSQTPQQMQDRLDAAGQRKADTGSARPEGDATKRDNTRKNYKMERSTDLADQYESQGYDPEQAEQMANAQTAQEMKNLDATHALDSIAGGGEDDPMGMGNSSVNRSIGAQWKTRVQALKDAVKKALQRGDEKMNIRLEPCED